MPPIDNGPPLRRGSGCPLRFDNGRPPGPENGRSIGLETTGRTQPQEKPAMVFSHVIGFDDAPFDRSHRGDVLVVGAVFCAQRLEGVVTGRVRRDGRNATEVLARLCTRSRWAPQLELVLLQGIAMAGFNVVDLRTLHELVKLPVLVVARRSPDLAAIRAALLGRVRGGARKWRLIEAAGPMEFLAGCYVQRAGIDAAAAARVVRALAVHGHLPEPLRTAHIIAGGVVRGESRGRP